MGNLEERDKSSDSDRQTALLSGSGMRQGK